MAVIQKIRERYAKWAGGLIALALIAFVVSEGLNSRFSGFFGDDNSVAKAGGHKIDRLTFDRTAEDFKNLVEILSKKGQAMTEEEQAQNRQQVLDLLVLENLMKDDADKLGLNVTEAERKELIYGRQPDPIVQQFMTTITGQQFEPGIVSKFEKDAPQQLAKSTDQSQRAAIQKIIDEWEAVKNYVVSVRVLQRYNALITNSVYTPAPIFNYNMAAAKQMAGVRYVKIPYTSINDNDPGVKVTDADINAYMEKHRAMFETDQPTRSIDYVVFSINPDRDDTGRALGALQGMKSEFAGTANTDEFVSRNTEERFSNAFVKKATYKSKMVDTIFNSPVGAVVGPFFENGTYQMVKVVAKKDMADSARAQHILIPVAQGAPDTMAHKLADSIMTAIKGGANFEALAMKYSADSGSRIKGGDLGYFGAGKMVPEFNDSVFNGSKGELKEVRTQFGWHIIRITDQKAFQPALKLATIAKQLNTGQAAYTAANAKATEFAGKNQTAAAFDEAVKKGNLNKRVAADLKPTDFVIPGLGAAREVIRWAWEAKQGEVSSIMNVGNDKIVVAKLAAIQEPGLRAVNAQMRPQIEAMIRAEKKAKIIMGKYKGTSLDAIAQSAAQPVLTADSVSGISSFSPKLGNEPRVIGYVFNPSFAVNAVSPAIQGREGVYFLQLTHRDPPAPVSATAVADPMLAQQRTMQDMQAKQAVGNALMETLRRNGNVKYYPKNF